MEKKLIQELIDISRSKGQACNLHSPYSAAGQSPDFEVEYEIEVDPELSDITIAQGVRCDFLFDGEDPKVDGVYMIWPEFLDDNGSVIINKKLLPEKKGHATMWIGDVKTKRKIRDRLTLGSKGYWVVGSKKIAKVTVSKILGLFDD